MTKTYSEYQKSAWALRRAAKGEIIGGGFVVFRRGNHTNRLKLSVSKTSAGHLRVIDPFEHQTLQAAEIEAKRLSEKYPGQTFVVLQQVACFSSNATDPTSTPTT